MLLFISRYYFKDYSINYSINATLRSANIYVFLYYILLDY